MRSLLSGHLTGSVSYGRLEGLERQAEDLPWRRNLVLFSRRKKKGIGPITKNTIINCNKLSATVTRPLLVH